LILLFLPSYSSSKSHTKPFPLTPVELIAEIKANQWPTRTTVTWRAFSSISQLTDLWT